MVKNPNSKLFKLVSDNQKMGKGFAIVQKGDKTGFPVYVLTLQERATCPSYCIHWDNCYGNGMPFAHRFQHGPELEAAIELQIAELAKKHVKGFLVRLHVLGDFYSTQYVMLWGNLLRKYPNLHVYGYTAYKFNSNIGFAIRFISDIFKNRCLIRFSTNDTSNTRMVACSDSVPGAVTCPQQTGKTESCLTCGLCFSAYKGPIQFLTHKKEKQNEV